MRKPFLLVTVLLLVLGTFSCQAAINNYSMFMAAHPQAIVADSHSATTISAEVRDSSGRLVPDDTIVDFTTSLGIIERQARTTSGVARVRLESGSTTGTALVSAVAANGFAVAQVQVDFLAPGTEMFDESFISVSSDAYLGYDPATRQVDSVGGVTIYHRGLTIKAFEAQISVGTNILRAKAKTGGDDITIQRGDRVINASALVYDLNSMKGVIIAPARSGAKRMLFRGRDMFTEPDAEPDESVTFAITPVAETKLFIKAKSLIIRPGVEIKFKRASYYVEGDKLISVPLQVLPLRGEGGGVDQMFAYGTDGVRMNIPFYYSLTPNGSGAVRLKHSDATGWGDYSGSSAWQVDLDQEYTSGGSTQGLFSLNRITTRDWGVRWNHRVEFDNDSRVYSYFDFPAHRDLYGTLDYSKSFANYTWSTSFRGNKRRSVDGSYSGSTYLQSRTKPLLSGAVSYAYSTRLSYESSVANAGREMGTGLGLQFYGKPLRFGQSASVSSSLNIGQQWGGSNTGLSIFANVGLTKMLGNAGLFGLNYTYARTDAFEGYRSHRLSTNLSLRPTDKWSTNLYATYGLGDRSASAFGDLGYTFLPTWRVGLIGTYQKASGFTFSDTEISLSKLLGRQEARLSWSKSRKKLRMEFTAGSF